MADVTRNTEITKPLRSIPTPRLWDVSASRLENAAAAEYHNDCYKDGPLP